jgi:hypothetical protein
MLRFPSVVSKKMGFKISHHGGVSQMVSYVGMEVVRAGSQARQLAPPCIFEKETKKIGISSNINPKYYNYFKNTLLF